MLEAETKNKAKGFSISSPSFEIEIKWIILKIKQTIPIIMPIIAKDLFLFFPLKTA